MKNITLYIKENTSFGGDHSVSSSNNNNVDLPEITQQKRKTIINDRIKLLACDKMDAWHGGHRKQNIEKCSDEKLKMNYKICIDKGYDKEAELLHKEAERRKINLDD